MAKDCGASEEYEQKGLQPTVKLEGLFFGPLFPPLLLTITNNPQTMKALTVFVSGNSGGEISMFGILTKMRTLKHKM